MVVEGCCHGELDKIYETILRVEEREGLKIDLLICCGDFQVSWEVEREVWRGGLGMGCVWGGGEVREGVKTKEEELDVF